MNLSDDERMLLKALAAAKEPMCLYDLMVRVVPPQPGGPTSDAGWSAVARAWINLRKTNLVGDVPRVAGGFRFRMGGGYEITEAGREALASSEVSRSGSCG